MTGDWGESAAGQEIRRQVLRQKRIFRTAMVVGVLLLVGLALYLLLAGEETSVVREPARFPADLQERIDPDIMPAPRQTVSAAVAETPRPPSRPLIPPAIVQTKRPSPPALSGMDADRPSPDSDSSPLELLESLYTAPLPSPPPPLPEAPPLLRALILRRLGRHADAAAQLRAADTGEAALRLTALIDRERGIASRLPHGAGTVLDGLSVQETDETRIRLDRYRLSGGQAFFTLRQEKIGMLPGELSGLRDNQTGRLLFSFLRGGGVEVRRPADGKRKFIADLFDFEMTARGSIELRYGGPGSSLPTLAGRGELDELRQALRSRADRLLRVSFSPDERSLAVLERDGTFSLFDAATAMSRYQIRRVHPPAADCRPFAWPRDERTAGQILYQIYQRERRILSVSRLDVRKLEESRIVSRETETERWQGVAALDRRALLFSCHPAGESRPVIFLCGHLGRHLEPLLTHAAWPVIKPGAPGFYFARGRELWMVDFLAVDTVECMAWLLRLDPRRALDCLDRWGEQLRGAAWEDCRRRLEEKKREWLTVFAFEEARILEAVGAVRAARHCFDALVLDAPDAWREAARAARDRLDALHSGDGQ